MDNKNMIITSERSVSCQTFFTTNKHYIKYWEHKKPKIVIILGNGVVLHVNSHASAELAVRMYREEIRNLNDLTR
jgi:hypothetical protein